jgi:hypothetical protein
VVLYLGLFDHAIGTSCLSSPDLSGSGTGLQLARAEALSGASGLVVEQPLQNGGVALELAFRGSRMA